MYYLYGGYIQTHIPVRRVHTDTHTCTEGTYIYTHIPIRRVHTFTHTCTEGTYIHTVLVDQSSPGLSTFHTISQQQENTFCKRTRSAVTWPHAHPPNICVLICVLVCVRAGAALYMCSYMCPYMCADPPNGRLIGGLYVLGGGSRDHAAVYVGFVHQHVCIFG